MPDNIGSSVGTWLGPIAGGAVSGAGGLISTAINVNEARKSREWQERMSNTAYQRAVKDMRAAGINPMVAFSKGGASTPSGATAQASGNALEGLGEGISTAVKQNKIDIPLAKAQADVQVASAQKIREEAEAVRVERQQSVAQFQMQLDKLRSEIANLGASTGLSFAKEQEQQFYGRLGNIATDVIDKLLGLGAPKDDTVINAVGKGLENLGTFPDLVKGAPKAVKQGAADWAASQLAGPGGSHKRPSGGQPGFITKPPTGKGAKLPHQWSTSETVFNWLRSLGNQQLARELVPQVPVSPRGDIAPHRNRNVRPGETNGGKHSAKSTR